MNTLSREELPVAIEYWMSLPFGLQLEGIIECGLNSNWDVLTLSGEIRNWMTMISSRDQIHKWGAFLYGVDPKISERDGEMYLNIVEYAWRKRQERGA